MKLDPLLRRLRRRKQSPAQRLAEQMRETASEALEQLRGAVDELWLARPEIPRPQLRMPRVKRLPRPPLPRRRSRGPAAVIRVGPGLRVRVIHPEGGGESTGD